VKDQLILGPEAVIRMAPHMLRLIFHEPLLKRRLFMTRQRVMLWAVRVLRGLDPLAKKISQEEDRLDAKRQRPSMVDFEHLTGSTRLASGAEPVVRTKAQLPEPRSGA
jgi:hypothetical protein